MCIKDFILLCLCLNLRLLIHSFLATTARWSALFLFSRLSLFSLALSLDLSLPFSLRRDFFQPCFLGLYFLGGLWALGLAAGLLECEKGEGVTAAVACEDLWWFLFTLWTLGGRGVTWISRSDSIGMPSCQVRERKWWHKERYIFIFLRYRYNTIF